MNRVLLAIGGLLVGLLALLFAAPAMVDWNRYRGVFEEEASRTLGREVRVGGRVNLRLLPVPYVQFEKVRVADTTASVGKPLFTADDFTVWLSVGSLLKGALEASAIELTRPSVTLVLDGHGGGSWSNLAPGTWQGSFVPSEVALSAVRITDGTFAVLASDGRPKTSFAHINGEMSAQALEGPYKVAAAFAHAEHPYEIRLSTAKPDATGAVRFKGTVRDPASGINWALDGAAGDILKHLAVTGELTARLPLPAAMLGGARARDGSSTEFDLKAQLKGDTGGFTLSDLALSFEQGGRPQLATGSARVAWPDRTDVSVDLSSHWLDIDRIAGSDTQRSPLLLAETMLAAMASGLGTEGHRQASIKIEQATLGGDVVSDLEAQLEQSKDKLTVNSLALRMPGGARLVTTGSFEPKAQANRYEGRVALRGANLTRFLEWAGRDTPLALATRDGAFAVTGDVSLGRSMVAARNLTVQIGRDVLTGEASWSQEPRPAIVLNLDGTELDLTSLVDKAAPPSEALKSLVAHFTGAAGKPSPTKTLNGDIKLRLDKLRAGTLALRDVDAQVRIADGNLAMPRLRFASDQGFAIEAQGDVAGLARPDAQGALTGTVSADSAAGLTAMGQLIGLPDDLLPKGDVSAMLAPLRLAGRVEIGSKGPDTRLIKADGLLAGSKLSGSLRLGADDGGWRTRAADLALSLEGPDLSRLTQRVSPAMPLAPAAEAGAPSGVPSHLRLRAIGSAKTGLESLVSIEAPGARGDYHGRISLEETGEVALLGDIDVALDDLERGLALVGARRPVLAGTVAGRMHVERSGGRLRLKSDRLAIAGTQVEGALTLEAVAQGRRLTGDLKLDKASLASALALLSVGGASDRSAPTAGLAGGAGSPWSEAALVLAPLEGLAGSRVRLDIGALTLAKDLAVSKARVELAVRANGIDMRLLEAKALEGSASGLINLDKAAAGAHVTLEARLAGAHLEALASRQATDGHKATASGTLSVTVKAQSTALTPRGLVVAMTGAGELATDRARLEQWTPAAVGTAAEAILAIKGDIPPGALAAQLELALHAGGVAIGTQKLTLRVADGTLAVAPLTVETPRGLLAGKAVVDLDHLGLEAEWRITPRNTPLPPGLPAKPELPGVTLRYSGPVALMGRLEPRLDYDALEREIAVRKVEREVAELERLRRLDEDRVRQEAERVAKEKLDAERRLAEKLRLESLPQALGRDTMPAPAATTPAPAGAGAAGAGAVPGTSPPGGAPAPSPAPAGNAGPPPAQSSAVPPDTVQRAPLPQARPASGSAPTPAKSKRIDPFYKLRDANP